MGGTEIDEQANIGLGGSEVVHQSHFVDFGELRNGFEFQDHLVFHEDVANEVSDWFLVVKNVNRVLGDGG